MEPMARTKFEEITGYNVLEVGLIVRQGFDFFGGSADGVFLNENGEVCTFEAKCPEKCKDKNIDMDYLEKIQIPAENGHPRYTKIVLKKNHPYYTQCQLQMFVTQSKIAHFFVYSSVDYKHVVIDYDDKLC